jgi:hypothetical protein
MSAFFPKWTNWLPLVLGVGAALAGGGLTAGVTYYFTPKYTRRQGARVGVVFNPANVD